jgi:hypothetical protein
MYIYVNGQQEGSHSTRAAGLVNTTTPISIGSKRTGNDPNYDGYFTGTIDEVAIYNHALDAATIQAHYAAAYGTSLKPFINIQPQPLTNYVTLPAVFSVGAAGSVPLAYQWKFKGADIAGATDSAYTNSSIALSDAGLYSVSVSNTLGGLVSSNALLTVLAAPTSTAHVQGLVLHLPFDNSLSDATGRGNNGMGYHSTTNSTNSIAPLPASNPNSNPNFFYTDGMVGNASLHYSTSAINTGGSTSIGVDDYYVSLGVRPDLQFSSNVSFTVSFWIRLPLGYTGGDLPFFTDAIGSEGNAGFVFAPAYGYGTASPTPTPAPLNYGGWAYTIYDAAGNGVRIYGDLGSVNDGNWHHLVYVISRVGDNSKVYLDGVLAHSTKDAGTEVSAAGVIDTGKPAIIGQDPTGLYGETGSADIDDLGVWRRALTPLEAAEIFMAANSGYSFADEPLPPFSITAECVGKRVTLNWPANVGLVLQSAGSPAGPYTDIIGAAPPFTVTATTNMFYRARY